MYYRTTAAYELRIFVSYILKITEMDKEHLTFNFEDLIGTEVVTEHRFTHSAFCECFSKTYMTRQVHAIFKRLIVNRIDLKSSRLELFCFCYESPY